MRINPVPGEEIDGYRVGECIHSGAMGRIFRVTRPDSELPMIMKAPRLGADEPSENLLSFQTEASIMPELSGPHVPRFIASSDLSRGAYLVTEWVEGESLDRILKRGKLPPDEVAHVGAAIADAVESLHRQGTIHLDLKPDNVIIKPSRAAVLIDFGLAHHTGLPDLLAEERRFAGSAPYISPEQVFGTRSDPRSDIFALGAMLYEMATGEPPFGTPETFAGMRDRLWLEPVPPRACLLNFPGWLQEVILRCLEPEAADRYQAAAHVAFDLRHPGQVVLSPRANKMDRASVFDQARRWWRAAGKRPGARLVPKTKTAALPVIMVAVDTTHPDDSRQPALQQAAARLLSLWPEFRLICVSVVRAAALAHSDFADSPSGIHLDHLVRLRQWIEPLDVSEPQCSLHVIESARPERTLLEFAHRNRVDLIVLGAPDPKDHALAWWRSVASGVTANARCSVYVVRMTGSVTQTEPAPAEVATEFVDDNSD